MVEVNVFVLAAICSILSFLLVVSRYLKELFKKRKQNVFKRYIVFRLI